MLIRPDDATVGFGDAWHEFSYGLSRERSADTATENGWKLELFNGGYPSPSRRLMTFTLNKADHLDQHAFIDQALKEYRRRFTLPNQDYYDVHSRLIFLLKFNEVELARQSIHDFAAAYPTDWTDQLLLWTTDHQVNPAAAKQIEAWADRMGDASAWLLVAGTYGREGGERNVDAMEEATQKALTMPLDAPQWLTPDPTYRAFMVCLQLYQARRYDTCASLCDCIIVFSKTHPGIGQETMAADLAAFRDQARNASAIQPATAPPKTPYGLMKWDPFADIDVPRLIVHPSKPPAP